MAERDALLDGRFVLQGMKWLMEKEKERRRRERVEEGEKGEEQVVGWMRWMKWLMKRVCQGEEIVYISLYTTLKRLDSHSIAPIILQPHPPSFYAVFHCSKPLLCIQRNKACSGNEGLIIMANQSEQSKSWDCVPKTRKR